MRYRRVRIEGASYFFTVVTHKRQKLFADDDAVARLMQTVASVQSAHPFQIDAYVILPDHLHIIWTLPENDSNYPMRWRQIKSAFTRSLGAEPEVQTSKSRREKSEETVWQRRYWEHTISSETDFATHVAYTHFNPVKHGLVAAPRDCKHSSFRAWVVRGDLDLNWGSGDFELAGPAVPE